MNKLFKTIAAITLCAGLCGIGSAVFAQEAPPENRTIDRLYGIGSVSKVFTAAAVMKLVDEGKLDLDAPLTTYIPEFTMKDLRYKDITPRMLLNHSSGLMGMTDGNATLIGDNDTYNHDNFLIFLKSQHLKHDPGELSVYSNDSLTLAEIMVERVSKMTFTEFLEINFYQPLNLTNIKTPQSDFDRATLAPTYFNGKELQTENFNVIGSGGIYSSMEDLARFGELFTSAADGKILSKSSTNEMASDQHKKRMVDANADTTFNYGLGWDSVETYPFNTLGIKALSKGGSTYGYHTNLLVLPEYNLSVAVSSSGQAAEEQAISQQIILAIMQEEGLIEEKVIELPEYDMVKAPIPQDIKQYQGVYDAGGIMGGMFAIEFTADTMLLTTIYKDNEHQQTYIYNQKGEFVSTTGDYIGMSGFASNQGGTRGVTKLTFTTDEKGQQFLLANTHGLSNLAPTALSIPFAQKIEPISLTENIRAAWKAREGKKYMLVSEKYSSSKYLNLSVLRPLLDDRIPGYVNCVVYQTKGEMGVISKIKDASSTVAYQKTPTMAGRDTLGVNFTMQNGFGVLDTGVARYIDEAAILNTSDVGNSISTKQNAVWYRVDTASNGKVWNIVLPENASYFVYDDKLNCISTSLEATKKGETTLPENGYLVFVGENAQFVINKE